MGIIRKTLYTTALTGAGLAAYLGGATTLVSPLPRDDPLWTSKAYARYNPHGNGSAQDMVVKRIPLDKIRPELLESKDGGQALTVEFCRGVWSGLGYRIQRAHLARKYHGPATASQLWTVPQLEQSTYEVGTQITDHFEVVDKTPTEITVRCGDSPRNGAPRDSDGLFIISAEIDRERGEAVLGLKSCFFVSARRIEGIQGPMPGWMEVLHTWYSRLWLETGAWRVTR